MTHVRVQRQNGSEATIEPALSAYPLTAVASLPFCNYLSQQRVTHSSETILSLLVIVVFSTSMDKQVIRYTVPGVVNADE